MRVLVTDYAWADLSVEHGVLEGIGVELVPAPDGNEETLARLAVGASGIMTCWAQTTRRVIEAALPDLKVVTRYGVGLDNIDVACATARKIPVAFVPDYCMSDVAEHAMALLLALSRKVAGFDRSVRGDVWDIQACLPLNRLTGQTLGLIGFGRIAREVALRAAPFGLRVLTTAPSLAPGTTAARGVEAVSLDVLLDTSDYVSVHCPSTDATRGLIDTNALRRMKPTACLVNTSRGDIVDETALADALDAGEIAGAALDVRVAEPPGEGDRLIGMPQVIHTPHAAFYSAESLIELRERAAMETRRVLLGEEPENLVNPEYRQEDG
ncbi:MAG: C-terminal binding protein [Gemmatimonadota bacterium]|nr:C-terminal binding protein [Gemmatimonadota bacterium]